MKRTIAPLLLGLIAGFFCLSVPAFAQNKTVSGKVTDAQGGAGLSGVSVIVKGSKTGTSTDGSGTYSLSVPNGATLVFSSVGFQNQEVAVGDRTTIDVVLTAMSGNNLNEVVVVGYGTVRKRDLTSAVTSIKAKDFNQGVMAAPDQLIQGKVAGLQVVTNSGAPGAATTIRIRGNSSIRSGNNPLFVVDGIPLDGRLARPGFSPAGLGVTPESNPLYFFNSADIAGMEVLKDASATAIYGSRGANGVIMITTKQGSSGAAKVDVSTSVAVSSVARKFDILDASGYRAALKSYNITSGDLGGNADALSEILRTGVTQNYNVGVSGGSENGKYRISLGYLGQQGIVEKTDMKRFTVNANGQYKFLKSRKLSLDFNIFAGHAKENIAPITNNAGFKGNLIGMALQWNPTQNLYNSNGTLNIIPGSSIVNPVAMQRGYTDISNIQSLLAVVGLGYKIMDGLDYRFNVSTNRQSGVRQAEIKRYVSLTEIENQGQGYQGNTQMSTTVLQHTLSYNKDLTKKLNMNALLGYEYQDFKFSGAGTSAIGFANDDVPFYNILQNAPASNRAISSFEDPDASLQSYFGRIGFNYDDRFIVSGTLRADGSSKFGENNKYGYFPSGSVAWNITNEEFLKTAVAFKTCAFVLLMV